MYSARRGCARIRDGCRGGVSVPVDTCIAEAESLRFSGGGLVTLPALICQTCQTRAVDTVVTVPLRD